MDIVLPDGSIKQFDAPITGLEFAKSIASSLAKSAIAMTVNGEQKDLSTTISENSQVAIITTDSEEGLEIMRHTVTAQLLARAVKNLYPSAKLAIGPTITDGFYYDVAFEKAISPEDLPKIEKEMRKILKTCPKVNLQMHKRDEAIAMFLERDESYKVQLIEGVEGQEEFQVYHQGETGFIDFCRGPHLPSMKHIGAFKLLKISGAYWKGDSNNEMLTRIYGTAWKNDDDLQAYLTRMEEAEKRDHRKICKEMDLMHMQGEEAPGQVFWHDKGWTVFLELENYIRGKLKSRGYQEVNTPRIINKSLFEKSGHWQKFGEENMFVCEAYDTLFALKPMNCPCHVQIFNQGLRSYKELPIKMSEFGNCLRQEARGALHGLMRVTSMTQDDAHIFCTHEQVKGEVVELCELIREIYNELGFGKFYVLFSDRPEQRVGSDEVWDAAEQALKDACDEAKIEWKINSGEGAFYGPKLEFIMQDCIGREWQCGTVQLDFNTPARLEATYIDSNSTEQNPVMIHRALLGSLERFIGIMIEHYAGHFPLWLSPSQIVVTGVTDKHNAYAEEVVEKLKAAGMRAAVDTRNEKINYKIREHMKAKTSIVGIVGDKEIADGTVTIRRLGENNQDTYPLDELIAMMKTEIFNKGIAEELVK